MTLVIDNYDSFTYNLVQLLGTMSDDIIVRRNDAVTVEEYAGSSCTYPSSPGGRPRMRESPSR
jgi:anthranilate/para-aminobenzoate synthase component II